MALPTGGSSDPGPIGAIGPQPDTTQGAAPGGLTMEGDLPMRAISGGPPATTNGYSPQGGQPPLPAPGSDEGSGR